MSKWNLSLSEIDLFQATDEQKLDKQRLLLLRHIRYQKELEPFHLKYDELHTQELKAKLKEVKDKIKLINIRKQPLDPFAPKFNHGKYLDNFNQDGKRRK